MAFVPFERAVQVNIGWTLGAGPFASIGFGLQYINDSFVLADMITVATQLEAWANAFLDLTYSLNATINAITVYDLREEDGPVYTNSVSIAGTRTGNIGNGSSAMCLTARTLKRGRSFRGRVYIPCLSDDDVANNAIAAAVLTAGENAMNALSTQLNPLGWADVVLSRIEDGASRALGVATVITDWEARNNVVTTQRRRIRRG